MTTSPAARLGGAYAIAFLAFLAGMAILWRVGIEGIYQHPTPFYALLDPAWKTLAVPAAALAMICAALALWPFEGSPQARLPMRRAGLGAFAVFALLALALLGVDLSKQGVGEGLTIYGPQLLWNALALTILFAGVYTLRLAITRQLIHEEPTSNRNLSGMLAALAAFSFCFALTIACIRIGPEGIFLTYNRIGYDYVDDIGFGGSILGFFSQYNDIHEHLTMHSKVRPPGTVVLLWMLSYIVGQGREALSIATAFVGSLGVIPLYYFFREAAGKRAAFYGSLLYVVVPSIVLFTATSADIMYLPMTMTVMLLFWRAITRASTPYALAAGAGYAIMTLCSFTLISVGAFFGFTGLWLIAKPETRWNVIKTAALMLLALGAVHGALYWATGFDYIECFRLGQARFQHDQELLDIMDPRFPGWVWRFVNPMSVFYFAGIPVSLLAIVSLLRGIRMREALPIVLGCTLFTLNLLYLARGEVERSGMYAFPFVVLLAAVELARREKETPGRDGLYATVAFLGLQCWFTEMMFFTYW